VFKPRGTAPGLTHPDLHALAVRAAVQKPCALADGAPVVHGLFNGVSPRDRPPVRVG